LTVAAPPPRLRDCKSLADGNRVGASPVSLIQSAKPPPGQPGGESGRLWSCAVLAAVGPPV